MRLTAYQMYVLFVQGSSTYYRCIAKLAEMIPWIADDREKDGVKALLYHFVAESTEDQFVMAYDRFMEDVHNRHGCGYENLEEAFRKLEENGYVWPEEV